MSKFGQELAAADEAPALPLWIDGHAYLMMADNFFNVQDQSGQVLRRVPLYGDEAVAIAANSGQLALDSWYALSYEKRKQCFRQFSELLTRYQDHFIQLIASESELGKEGAKEEVLQALRTAENARPGTHGPGYRKRIGAVISTPEAPFALALDCVMQALEAHWAVILKPCPKVPSALFACAELFSRAGFPGGLINCVQDDEAAINLMDIGEELIQEIE